VQYSENRLAIIAACCLVQSKFIAKLAAKFPNFFGRNLSLRDDGFYAGCGYPFGAYKVLFLQWLLDAQVRVPQHGIGIWFVVAFVSTKSLSDSLPMRFRFYCGYLV